MRKILLFSTAILVATSVLAFGGGGKSRKSSVYRGTGVDSIGVHINGKDDDSSEETCPADKQCGNYCCQGDNICKQTESGEYQCCSEFLNYCCSEEQSAYGVYRGRYEGACCEGTLYHVDYDPYADWDRYNCCAPENTVYKGKGIKSMDLCCAAGYELACGDYDKNGKCLAHNCCSPQEKGYCTYRDSDDNCTSIACCSGTIYPRKTTNSADLCCKTSETVYCVARKEGECLSSSCCPGEIKAEAGYNNADMCYAENYTGCKTNEDCTEYGDNYYCHISGSQHPTNGACREIGDYSTVSIDTLGTVHKSNTTMTWWSAVNWCKAQSMQLIEITDLACYKSETNTLVTELSNYSGGCCIGNNASCTWDNNWYNMPTYSNVLKELYQKFGDQHIWTGSWYAINPTYHSFTIYAPIMTNGSVSNSPNLAYEMYALCK